MLFVNMEVTPEQCDAVTFFLHVQEIIYNFEDTYRS